MKLSCVIIDDEPLAINVIRNYISQVNGLELQHTFSSALESLEYLKQHQVDLLFVDINMPVLDGFSFIKTLSYKPKIIITTAYEEYAAKSYELDVLDYLVKPIPFPRFIQAVNKVQNQQQDNSTGSSPEADYIFVKINKKKMKKIELDDILVVESLKDYIKIVTKNGNHIVHQTLSSFTESLPRSRFLRIHRSFTISVDKVETIEGNSLEVGGKRYTIGRSYLNETKEAILNSGV